MRAGRWERDWVEVLVSDVQVGDVYANNGSVTKVVHGPGTVRWGGDTYKMEEGFSFIACGKGMAITKAASTSRRVVGRNARWVAS